VSVRLKIVYMGSSDFAVPALAALHLEGFDIPFVVTQPDRMRGRGWKVQPTPVGLFAETNGLTALKPEYLKGNADFVRTLAEAAPNLIVVAAYGKILPKQLLELPPFGCVNIHASLLPEYRGAAPVQRAILEGKQELGVTLVHMSERLDAGEMIAAASTDASGMNAGELTDTLARMGAGLLIKMLPGLMAGTAPRIPQDEAKATYAEKVEKSEGRLDLRASAKENEQRVRAMTPVPGAYLLRNGERIGVTQVRVISPDDCEAPKGAYEAAAPGTVLSVSEKGIGIRTGDGVLLVEALKAPGKKAMPVREYLKGNAFDTAKPLE